MKYIWLMLTGALTAHATVIIDASTATSALLHQGDSLAFQVLAWNFGINATRFGLDRYPTDVSFTFITAAAPEDASVSAWLESPDSSVIIPFSGPLKFAPGFWSSSQFRGRVSTLQGYLHLSDALSTAIFGTGAGQLVLRNEGGDLLLGSPPSTLRQDLSVSLAGGPLSVGALSGGVNLQSESPEPAMLLPALLALAWMVRRAR